MPSRTIGPTQPEGGKKLVYAAILIAIIVFGTSLAQPQVLGRLPLRNLLKNELHTSRTTNAAFFFWMSLAWYFKPFFGIVTDAFPLFGSRRKSYMLITAGLAVLSWGVLGFTPHQYNKLLWACIFINIFMMATSTVVGGYMVETAHAISGSGRLTSIRNFVEQFCLIITGPAAGFLASIAFGWTTAVCAGVMFLSVPATVLFLREQRKKTDSKALLGNARKQLFKIASARTMWAATGFMALFYCAPGIATALFYKQQNELHLTTQGQGRLVLLSGLFGVVAAALYGAFACRRFNLRTLLLCSLGICTLANLGFLYYSSIARAQWVESFNGFSYTLAEVALMDLAVRATPSGSEGLGFSLMVSARNFTLMGSDWFGSKLLDSYHLHFNTLVIANAATTLIAIPLVLLLPVLIVRARDAQAEEPVPECVPVPVYAFHE